MATIGERELLKDSGDNFVQVFEGITAPAQVTFDDDENASLTLSSFLTLEVMVRNAEDKAVLRAWESVLNTGIGTVTDVNGVAVLQLLLAAVDTANQNTVAGKIESHWLDLRWTYNHTSGGVRSGGAAFKFDVLAVETPTP